ncbi:MAG: hypothetical protein RL632_1546 [Bacteroidota bacterium]
MLFLINPRGTIVDKGIAQCKICFRPNLFNVLMKNLNLGTHIPKTPNLLFTCLLVAATILSSTLHAQTTLCVGGTSQITYSGGGGSWVSGNTAVATVNSTGLVTAVGAGSTTVNYQTSSSTNTSLYWDFESGSSNPSGGVFSFTPTTTSNSSLLSGFFTQTGSGTYENFSWAPGSPGWVPVQRQNPSQFSYIQFTTNGSTTVSSVTFTKYHNNNSCCAGSSYQMKLQISVSNGTWTDVGSAITCASGGSGSGHTVTINSSVPAGTHKIRWIRVSGSNGGDYFAVNNVTLSCSSSSTSVLNTNTINVNTAPAQPSTITSPSTICLNSAVTYSVTNVAGVTYTWSYSGTGTITGTGNSISLNASTNGTLTVTPSNSCGNGTPRTFAVSITALNAGAHNSDALNICDGGNPANLTFTTAVSGGVGTYTYQWQLNGAAISGSTANSYDPPALTPGTYSYNCKITDACGTVAYTTPKVITVTADPDAPTAVKSPSSAGVCVGTTLTLATPAYGINGGQACGFEYAYSTDNGTSWSATSSTVPSFAATGTVNKIRVRVIGGCANGCNSSAWTEYSWNVGIQSLSTAPVTGDIIWRGVTNTNWNTASNWYVFNGSIYAVATAVPNNTNNIIIPANQTCVLAQPSVLSATTNAAKNVTIESGATLTLAGGTLNVAGNWTNNGTFTGSTGTVSFIGTGSATLGGTSSTSFANLSMDKNGSVSLAVPVTVSASLALNNGIIELGANNLTLGAATVTGGSATSYVKTASTGTLSRIGSSTATTFPVGNSAYNPAELTNNGTSDVFSVRVIDNVTANGTGVGATSSLATVKRTWMISEATTGGSNASVRLYWNGAGEEINGFAAASAYVAHYSTVASMWENMGGSVGADYVQSTDAITNFSPFTISSTNTFAPLPVELLSFDAQCADQDVIVRWTTATEHNSLNFAVQRSEDGTTWADVQTVAAAGNSNTVLDYAIQDLGAAREVKYYRLIQTDQDGVQKIYGPIQTNCGSNALSFLTFPNPSTEEFTILFGSTDIQGDVTLTVSDATGKVVRSAAMFIEKGTASMLMPSLDLSPGVYQLQLNGDHFQSAIIKHSIR